MWVPCTAAHTVFSAVCNTLHLFCLRMHQQVFVAASVVLLAVWHALGDMPCLHCAHVKYQQACTAACIVFSAVECTWKQCMHQQALNVAAKGFARLFACRTAVYIQKRQALHLKSGALL